MLRSRLTDTVDSPNVTAILHSPEARKLLVAKGNGDIEIYYREHDKLKLYQTYPELLQSSETEESRIFGLYESYELSTVFARCDKSLLLFNSTNLHQYDRVVDRRGIENCWIFEVCLLSSDEKRTFLMYSIRNTPKLRMLIWKGRAYKKIVEATLSRDKETVQSAQAGKSGILIATNLGVYHWSYGESVLSRIEKIVRRRYPQDPMRLLADLKSLCDKKSEKSEVLSDAQSYKSSSQLTKKSSILNFWSRDHRRRARLDTVRFLFSPGIDENLLLDGMTNNLFTLEMTNSQLPYMIASNHTQFAVWNSNFSHIQYLSLNLLMMNSDSTVRFVDYENGFIFLEQEVPQGVKEVKSIDASHFIVLTAGGQLQLYHFKVDDGSEDSFEDDESICGLQYDSDFYQLWRKVLFYGFFLASPDRLELCSSDNTEQSLDICALKLRDLTVMWCLEIFDRLPSHTSLPSKHNRVDENCSKLESLIVEKITDKLIDFWAPPQLIILKTFPPNIARLVGEITNQGHHCMLEESDSKKSYHLSQDLLRKSLLPYLIQIRRPLKLLLKEDNVVWEYSGRKLKVGVDFFLIDKHDSAKVSTLLALIDTVLFMTYLLYFPSMISPFLSVDSMCDYSTVVKELRKRHMFQDLVCFYFQRKEHTEALKFLTDLADDLPQEPNKQELQSGVKLLVIDYLKKLSDENLNLIFQYSDWLLERSSSKRSTLESIFINDSPAYATRNHYEVYRYIDRHDPELALEYLEFAISTFRLQDIKLHTTLIKRYFENLDDAKVRLKLRSILETTSAYEPRTILRLLEENSATGEKTLSDEEKNFLEYLKIFPLQKLKSFKQAVDILYEKLSDYNSTSVFCEKVYENNTQEGQEILEYLFKKIIASTQEPQNPQIANFIREHGSKLNVVDVCKLLPSNLMLSDLKQVLLQTIKLHSIEKDSARVRRGLLQADLVLKNNELNKSLSKYVVLDEGYKCPICKKSFSSFTTDTALWFTIDGRDVVVHYTCGKTLEAKIQSKSAKAKIRGTRTVSDLKGYE